MLLGDDSTTASAPALSGVNPSAVTKNYVSVNTAVCTVDSSTGLVTEVEAGICEIDLTLSKDATYNNNVHRYSFFVDISADEFERRYFFSGMNHGIGSNLRLNVYDVNGDGNEDLIMGSSSGTVHYFETGSNGGFNRKTGDDNPFDGINIGTASSPAINDNGHLFIGYLDGSVIYTNCLL